MATTRRRISLYQGPKGGLKREELETYEKTGLWAFEEKHDGFWACTTVQDGVIVQLLSRVGIDLDAGSLLGTKLPGGGSGQLVGELTADLVDGERCGMRRLRLFDVLTWNGLELRDLPLSERRQALEMVYSQAIGASEFVTLVEHRTTGAVAFYDEVTSRKGEGLVIKRLDSKYRPQNADGKVETWFRCKPEHTVDMVVMQIGVSKKTTTQPGGSPNIEVGLWKDCKVQGRKLIMVQAVAVPMDLRGTDLTQLVGKVVELKGAEIWPSGAVRHGSIQRVREDKLSEDCTHEAAMRA